VLVEQRPDDGRMASMWQLPTIEVGSDERIAPARHRGDVRIVEVEPLGELRHAITHHLIRARVAVGRIASGDVVAPYAWHRVDALGGLARTGMTRKIEARDWLGARVSTLDSKHVSVRGSIRDSASKSTGGRRRAAQR